jgi:hypothetical protein
MSRDQPSATLKANDSQRVFVLTGEHILDHARTIGAGLVGFARGAPERAEVVDDEIDGRRTQAVAVVLDFVNPLRPPGAIFAGEGRHGSINPTGNRLSGLGRLPSRLCRLLGYFFSLPR